MIYSHKILDNNNSARIFSDYCDKGFADIIIYKNPYSAYSWSRQMQLTRKMQSLVIRAKPNDFSSAIYVHNRDDIPKHLMRKKYWALRRFQTPKIVESRVKADPSNIKYVRPAFVTPELAQIAVDHDVNLFRYVARHNLLSEDALVRVLERDATQIRYIKRQMITEKLALTVIGESIDAIYCIKRCRNLIKFETLCKYLRREPRALENIMYYMFQHNTKAVKFIGMS